MIIRRIDRGVHHASKPGHKGRERKHDREPLVDIDTEQADSLTISHTGANDHPEGGVSQEGEHPADDGGGEHKINQAPIGVYDRTGIEAEQNAEIGTAGESRRSGCRDRIAP